MARRNLLFVGFKASARKPGMTAVAVRAKANTFNMKPKLESGSTYRIRLTALTKFQKEGEISSIILR